MQLDAASDVARGVARLPRKATSMSISPTTRHGFRRRAMFQETIFTVIRRTESGSELLTQRADPVPPGGLGECGVADPPQAAATP